VCARLHKRGPAKIVDGGGHIRPRTHKRRITCIMLINGFNEINDLAKLDLCGGAKSFIRGIVVDTNEVL
jgi:hypothetical protein